MSSTARASEIVLKNLKKFSELAKTKLQVPKNLILPDTRKWYSQVKSAGKNFDARRYMRETLMTHYKFGLYTEDLINDDLPAVIEALNRLPRDVYDARTFRIMRAIQLDALKVYLPPNEWIHYEDDINVCYLTPLIIEVEIERQEKREYGVLDYDLYKEY